MSDTDFTYLLQGFFIHWLAEGRNLSPHTISAYRDTFSLFLRWVRDTLSIDADTMTMDDFTAENVTAFLGHLAAVRGNSPRTLNCRLAAIHSFCRYALYRNPQHIDTLRRVLAIPTRRTHVDEVDYLTTDEIGMILSACDLGHPTGRATHLMISLLFNTGARISELVSLKAADIQITGTHARVHLTGKGRKQRCLPLWPETVAEIVTYLADTNISGDDSLFPGRHVTHLTRSGARNRLDTTVAAAVAVHPCLAAKTITPHTFRHSTAMAMLQAGIDLSTIAIWLGHENIQTTHKYMVADMALKEAAIATVHPSEDKTTTRYQPPPGILDFLLSL